MKVCSSMVVKLLLLWSLLVSAAVAGEQGRLWQISGKGAEGYLFGTMHSEDPRVTRLPLQVEQRFAAANTLVLEVLLDERNEMAAAVQMRLPAQSSLTQLVGEAMAAEVKEAMRTRGVPPEASERLQLWATALTLSLPAQRSGQYLDKLLYQRAVAQGKKRKPLESVNEQLAIFTAFTLEEQRLMLRNVLASYQHYPALFEQMTEAYLAGDLDLLMQLGEENPMSDDPVLQQRLKARLLTQRNRRMAERMEPLLTQPGLFIAIGALHLPGDDGVIALLRQRGYQLQPVD
ncbi:MAG: TraB/GumN family protein [Gammaproteobacteria bacterium]|nr:TraB/GumN family protein [Gammaproteobacteria bacterium]